MATETKTGLEGLVKIRFIAGTASVAAGSNLSYVTDFSYTWDTSKKDPTSAPSQPTWTTVEPGPAAIPRPASRFGHPQQQ